MLTVMFLSAAAIVIGIRMVNMEDDKESWTVSAGLGLSSAALVSFLIGGVAAINVYL